MAILETLAQGHGFTKTERDIASYVLAHPDDVMSMSIGDLASASFTSPASIVRLCHKVGVDGYREFRIALASDLERARSSETDINPDTPFLENQGTREMMSSIASLKKLAIDQSYSSISTQAIQKAARLILAANRVALFAIGDSEISCEGFINLLLKIGVICYAANQHGDSRAVSTGLGPRDLAVFVTYSGTLMGQMHEELRILRERRCKTIVISSDESLPDRIAGLDCFIRLPHGESLDGKIATFFAQSSIRYALESIYGECFLRNYRENIEHLRDYAVHRHHSSNERG